MPSPAQRLQLSLLGIGKRHYRAAALEGVLSKHGFGVMGWAYGKTLSASPRLGWCGHLHQLPLHLLESRLHFKRSY
jgi:hypothetical protein